MSSGLLWAALSGGAKAGMQVLDDRAKREDDERKRAQSMEERKEALLFEMKAKADFARAEEEHASGAAIAVAERGTRIGNERGARELENARSTVPNEGEFANERITPEMIASLPPAARSVYERDMGLTDDSTLQGLSDQLTASRELGSPATVRKGLLDSHAAEARAVKDAREQQRKELRDDQRTEAEQRRAEQGDRRLDQQMAIAQQNNALGQQRIEAYVQRGAAGGRSAGGIDQTEKLTVLKDIKAKADASKPRRSEYRSDSKYDAALSKWQESDDGQLSSNMTSRINRVFGSDEADAAPPSAALARAPTPTRPAKAERTPWISPEKQSDQVRAVQEDLARQRARGNVENVKALERELTRLGAAPAAAQQSTKKDNQAPSKAFRAGQTQVIQSGPHKGKTATYDGTGWTLK